MGTKDWALSIINLGVEYHDLEYSKRQARLLNVLISISVLVLLPIIIIFNASQKVYAHVYLGLGALFVCSICWVLSARGRTTIAGNTLIISIMVFIVVTTLVAEVQSAAPALNCGHCSFQIWCKQKCAAFYIDRMLLMAQLLSNSLLTL